MRNEHLFPDKSPFFDRVSQRVLAQPVEPLARFQRQVGVGLLLVIALLAFEVFNFDTTRFALGNLLGDVSFAGLRWASILALAFCAIDFAGLAHLFGPLRNEEPGGETWYLMGAWFLGATMNAVMTWWAVNLTLLDHQLGNEILSREQLLNVVPIFVAVLVWLTRILFIGAFSIAGAHIFQGAADGETTRDSQGSRRGPFEQHQRRYASALEPSRPIRDSAQFAPARPDGRRRPIPRAPRTAPVTLSTRGRHRS